MARSSINIGDQVPVILDQRQSPNAVEWPAGWYHGHGTLVGFEPPLNEHEEAAPKSGRKNKDRTKKTANVSQAAVEINMVTAIINNGVDENWKRIPDTEVTQTVRRYVTKDSITAVPRPEGPSEDEHAEYMAKIFTPYILRTELRSLTNAGLVRVTAKEYYPFVNFMKKFLQDETWLEPNVGWMRYIRCLDRAMDGYKEIEKNEYEPIYKKINSTPIASTIPVATVVYPIDNDIYYMVEKKFMRKCLRAQKHMSKIFHGDMVKARHNRRR